MSRLELTTAAYAHQAEAEIIARWWRDSGVEPLPANAMPRHGMWAMHGENRMAAAFAYLTMTDLAILAFAIANPHIDKRHQAPAVACAIEAVMQVMRDTAPNTVLVSLCHDRSLHQTYVKRSGFRDTGKVWIGAAAPADLNLDILTA